MLSAMERNREMQERMAKAMLDSICVQSELAEVVGRLRGAVEDLNGDNRRREEREEGHLRKENKWRREWNGTRDEDRRGEA